MVAQEEMLKTFKQDRYAALMSLDMHVIAQYCAKWGVPPGGESTCRMGIYP